MLLKSSILPLLVTVAMLRIRTTDAAEAETAAAMRSAESVEALRTAEEDHYKAQDKLQEKDPIRAENQGTQYPAIDSSSIEPYRKVESERGEIEHEENNCPPCDPTRVRLHINIAKLSTSFRS